MMTFEVLMSAYNDAHNLKPVFDGYLLQTDQDFSICIADDGSGQAVKQIITEYQKKGLKIRHIWHEDKGFRRSIILNKGIETSSADRIIFSDSDCIPSTFFIEDHRKMAKPDLITCGPRVLLRDTITKKIHDSELDISYLFNTPRLLFLSLLKEVAKPEQAFRFPNALYPLLKKMKKISPYGANMSVDRKSLLAVNGFNEDYLGWGGEDTDLIQRLFMKGNCYEGNVGRAVLYHLCHPIRVPHDGNPEFKKLKEKSGKHFYASNGIVKNSH